MSRAAIETLLKNDSTLAGKVVAVENQWDIKERPSHTGRFIILRWEEPNSFGAVKRSSRLLTVCVHSPKEFSTDFEAIDQILDRVDKLFDPIEHLVGSDGYTITEIQNSGRSSDFYDEAFNTVYRTGAYAVLYRRSTG